MCGRGDGLNSSSVIIHVSVFLLTSTSQGRGEGDGRAGDATRTSRTVSKLTMMCGCMRACVCEPWAPWACSAAIIVHIAATLSSLTVPTHSYGLSSYGLSSYGLSSYGLHKNENALVNCNFRRNFERPCS